MFPTMELLLRHTVNYFNMKKSKAVAFAGIIDSEDDFSGAPGGRSLPQPASAKGSVPRRSAHRAPRRGL
jgi:hypothetical protein